MITDIALVYIGDGAWIPGVPARNLTETEAKVHTKTIMATAAAGHKLYVPVTHDPPVKKSMQKESKK